MSHCSHSIRCLSRDIDECSVTRCPRLRGRGSFDSAWWSGAAFKSGANVFIEKASSTFCNHTQLNCPREILERKKTQVLIVNRRHAISLFYQSAATPAGCHGNMAYVDNKLPLFLLSAP